MARIRYCPTRLADPDPDPAVRDAITEALHTLARGAP